MTKWEENRVIFALEYLVRKELIYGDIDRVIGEKTETMVFVSDVSPDGIDTIENPDRFKRNFGHTVNLGIYQFSWGATEK